MINQNYAALYKYNLQDVIDVHKLMRNSKYGTFGHNVVYQDSDSIVIEESILKPLGSFAIPFLPLAWIIKRRDKLKKEQ